MSIATALMKEGLLCASSSISSLLFESVQAPLTNKGAEEIMAQQMEL